MIRGRPGRALHTDKDDHMRNCILALVFLFPVTASAQQVYKCVKGKDVSYQSAPCDASHTVAKQWDATPDPEPTPDQVAQREARSKQDAAESARLRRAAGTDRPRVSTRSSSRSSISAADARCKAAKERRARKLESVGLKRTFDLLRKLDDDVHNACKP
jgi:hypothetical protein